MSGRDLYNKTVVVSSNNTFHAKFPNIFVNYPLGPIRVVNKVWTNWNKAPQRLWQTQLNFAVCCASSACRFSSEHLNYAQHPLVLKRLRLALPHEAALSPYHNPSSDEGFFKICDDYEVSHNLRKYRDEKFFGTHQHGGLSHYINPDSMTCWIIEKSQRFTDVGLLRISESVTAYTYLVLSFQASARSKIVENMASALTARKAFLNIF